MADACGIAQAQQHLAQYHGFLYGVSGCPCLRGHDGTILAKQHIQDRGLSCVRSAKQYGGDALADRSAVAIGSKQLAYFRS